MRVLFVDDEPILLRSIERLVRMRRARFEARFATSGEDALALLEVESFDIIVSDLGMPVMDGVTLLGNVRDRFPHVARLALTGQSAAADGVRAVRVVHQWISKPCDFGMLAANLEHLAWVRSLISDPVLLARISELASLPSPPRLFLQVSDALARAAPMSEIVTLIETDPAVVAKLLQLVNSAFFATAERVTSVARAVALIGTDTLRGLLIGADVFRAGNVSEELVEHCLLVATLARELVPPHLAGDVFIAGMLHDLGKIIVPESPALHAVAGGLLLGLWGLPNEIVTATAYHHDPDAAPRPHDPVLRAVALADALVAELADPAQSARVEAVANGATADLPRHRERAKALAGTSRWTCS